MNGTRRIAFLALSAALVLFPLALVGWNEIDLRRGKEIRLLVQPVDPNDFFRGEYVALSYGISNLQLSDRFEPGDSVYVPLTRTGELWTGGLGLSQRPPSGTFIRGRVTNGFPPIRYGIETFFVPEGKARTYEDAVQESRLVAVVSLKRDGTARLKELEVR